MKCRFCQNPLQHVFVDLNDSPPSNSFLTPDQASQPESRFPLKIFVCEKCWLVQVDEHKKANEIFSDAYVYFSSYSKSWLAHAKQYVDLMTSKFGLNSKSQVIEIASNDGYLLQYFVEKGIPVLGIEPTANTAEVAREKGVPSWVEFFGVDLAKRIVNQGYAADLMLGNNVLAHVPDINDFVGGLKIALKPQGVVTMEFPHLMQLVANNQFDTIYHEHFSYLSFTTVSTIFAKHGLVMFDVEQIPTHGGSLRIYAAHQEDTSKMIHERVKQLLEEEQQLGMKNISYYSGFQEKTDRVASDFLNFLMNAKKNGKQVVGYGAAAKGNTLMNYAGVDASLMQYVVDANPHKQNMLLPGTKIPVKHPSTIHQTKPDYVVILPWNIKEEVMQQLQDIRFWGGEFVVAIPSLQIL